jgi:hypothetical protein
VLEEKGGALSHRTLEMFHDPHGSIAYIVRSRAHFNRTWKALVESNSKGSKHGVGLTADMPEPGDLACKVGTEARRAAVVALELSLRGSVADSLHRIEGCTDVTDVTTIYVE